MGRRNSNKQHRKDKQNKEFLPVEKGIKDDYYPEYLKKFINENPEFEHLKFPKRKKWGDKYKRDKNRSFNENTRSRSNGNNGLGNRGRNRRGNNN